MSKNTKFVFNPFTAELDTVVERASSAEAIVVTRVCLVSSAVLDLVMESTLLLDGVDSTSDNTDIRPVIGMIISKPTTTTCEVLMLGAQDGFSGLTKGGKVFLGTDGNVTQTLVATGYIQNLGVASDTDTINFNPQLTRVLRT